MRKKSVWKKALLITAAAIFILAGIGMVVLYNIGDKIIEEAITAQAGDLDSQLDAALDGTDDQTNENTLSETSSENSGSTATVATKANGSNNNAQTTTSNQNSQQRQSSQKPASNDKAKTSATEGKLTIKQIKGIKDQASPIDKVEAATLVLTRLTSEDINKLTNMLSGGITAEEKEEAKKIAYSRFTPEEIQKIQEMYVKYTGELEDNAK